MNIWCAGADSVRTTLRSEAGRAHRKRVVWPVSCPGRSAWCRRSEIGDSVSSPQACCAPPPTSQVFLSNLDLVLHDQTPAGSNGYLPASVLDSSGHREALSSRVSSEG